MKNKHLLLIFFCTLMLGLIARYAPWFKGDIFQTDLMRIDQADLLRLSITLPGKPELLLERSDEGWVASQDDFAVSTPDSSLAPILAALSRIRSIRIVDTNRPDTLLLLPAQSIHVEVLLKNGRKELFEIGREVRENETPATFIEIDRHEGIYLTHQHLRSIFARTIDDFRNKSVLIFEPETLESVRIVRPGIDTAFFQKSDTSAQWLCDKSTRLLQPEDVLKWAGWLQELNALPFASHSNESHAAENLAASIALKITGSEEPLVLQIFSTSANTYAMKRSDHVSGRQKPPSFVVISSQNTANFFALSDTLLAGRIRTGPVAVIAPD